MLNFIQHLTQSVSTFSTTEIATTVTVFIGLLLRVIPSQKPMCVFLFLENLMTSLGSFFGSVSTALNAIVPQNVTPGPVTVAQVESGVVAGATAGIASASSGSSPAQAALTAAETLAKNL